MSEVFVVGGGALLGLLLVVVQLAILLYVLSLLRRVAEGIEYIGAALDRLAPRNTAPRLTAEAPLEWVGRPIQVQGLDVVPGARGQVVDHGDELLVAFGGVTFACDRADVRPLR